MLSGLLDIYLIGFSEIMSMFRRMTICLLALMMMAVFQVHGGTNTASMPNGHPFDIICYNNGSLMIQQNISYTKDLIVVGNPSDGSHCPQYKNHFRINNTNTTIDAKCKDIQKQAFLIEVQTHYTQPATTPVSTKTQAPPKTTTTPNLVGGNTSTVYRVTCDADPGGNSETVKLDNAQTLTVKPSASELVLPALKMAFYPTAPGNSFTSNNNMSQVHIGQEVYLVIYNDRSGGLKPYKLIPTSCEAYPVKDPNSRKTILTQNGRTCVYESDVIGKFTVNSVTNADVAWTKLYAFEFETKPDSAVMIECQVTLCPQTSNSSTGVCRLKYGNQTGSCVSNVTGKAYTRRKRDVGMDTEPANRIVRAKLQIRDASMMGSNVDNSCGAILPVWLTLVLPVMISLLRTWTVEYVP